MKIDFAKVFCIPLSILLGTAATGEVIYVNKAATGLNNGNAWANAFVSLQSALDAAEIDSRIDQVWIAAGTYLPSNRYDKNDPRSVTFRLLPNLALYGGFSGNETSVEQRDWEANETILSCDLNSDDSVVELSPALGGRPTFPTSEHNRNDNCYHVLMAVDNSKIDKNSVLDGITVTHGHAFGADGADVFHHSTAGGGMYVDLQAAPAINNCKFTHNFAFTEGGALVHRGQILVSRSIFAFNYGGDGGAIMSGSHFNEVEGGLFSHNLYKNNVAWIEGGAAIIAQSHTIHQNCIVMDNWSSSGGAFTLGYHNINAKIINCLVVNNRAERAGGALTIGGANIEIASSIFWNNLAILAPGQISLVGGASYKNNNSYVGDLDPGFVNAADGDFHLRHDSQARDKGDPEAAYTGQVDFDGAPRVMSACSSRVDMGPYEFYYPNCWNSRSQCLGDANSDRLVDFLDLPLLHASLEASYGDKNYDACADFNKDGHADASDLEIINSSMYSSPDSCECGGVWPPESKSARHAEESGIQP